MVKAADQSSFVREQAVMRRLLRRTVSEIVRLVGCLWPAAVSTHVKGMYDSEISSRRPGLGRPRVIKGKGSRILSYLLKQNRCQAVQSRRSVNNQIQYRSKYNCFGVIAKTVGYRTTQQTSHSHASFDQASSLTTPTLCSGPSWMDHGPVGECWLVVLTIRYSSRWWPCQGMPSSRGTVAPQCTAGHILPMMAVLFFGERPHGCLGDPRLQ